MGTTQSERAQLLRRLHQGPEILVLPNAWDVASARVFEESGYPAIATTSAGVAAVLGYPDGQHIPGGEMLEMVGRIARAVAVPVTADVEAGYEDAVTTAQAVWSAGAVGLNLEDTIGEGDESLADLTVQIETIREIRAAVPEMVINARTDIYLAGVGVSESRFERAVERANAYREAGADCLFVPGVRDAETIGRLVRTIKGPVNILATAGSPPIAELKQLGVRRVSVGSGPMRATLGLLQRIARELKDDGTFRTMTDGAMTYADANRLFGG